MLQEKRSILSVLLVLALVLGLGGCGDDGAKTTTITLAGPVSLTGKYLETSAKTINGAKAALLWIDEHGGFKVGGNNGVIELVYQDDESDSAKVEEITTSFCQDETVDFLMAPYSSGLTLAAAPITEEASKILLVPGGASNTIYTSGYTNVVASIGPASAYHKGILDAVKAAEGDVSGIKVAFAYEDAAFSKSVQDAAVAYAGEQGFATGYNGLYPAGADDDSAELDAVVADLVADAPDIVLGGGHSVDGRALTRKINEAGLLPRAFSLLVAPVDEDFYNLVEACPAPCDYANHPAEGVSGPSHWEIGVGFSQAAAETAGVDWYGPSQSEFLEAYKTVAGADQEPSYHAANGAVMILALVLALEDAGSNDTQAVRNALGSLRFMSFWGMWDVDETGANTGHQMVEAQWQQGEKEIVWPDEGKTSDFNYPIH